MVALNESQLKKFKKEDLILKILYLQEKLSDISKLKEEIAYLQLMEDTKFFL